MLVRECDYILKVYEEQSFSRASEQLYITQPSLSIAIKKFESNLGIIIFDRTKSPVQLTAEGKYFMKTLLQMKDLENSMHEYFLEQNAKRTGTVNIASTGYYRSYVLPEIIEDFREKYPGYTVNLHEVETGNIIKQLTSAPIDVCMTVKDIHLEPFAVRNLYQENLLLAVPAVFPVNEQLKKYRLTFEEIKDNRYLKAEYPSVPALCFKDIPFLMLRDCNDTSIRGREICQEAGFEPQVALCLDQMLTTYYVAAAGEGAAFIRSGLIHNVESTNKLYFYKIDNPKMARYVKLYYRKQENKGSASADFITFIEKWYRESGK